jgi:hypothetical protein
VEDAWAAYQFDAATLSVGASVETALADGKSIDEVFAESAPAGARGNGRRADATRYRDPTPFVTERIAIPPSGIW